MGNLTIIEIENEVRKILQKTPSECGMLDYKAKSYELNEDKGKHDLIKDVIAMLNSIAHVGENKYIILGVADNKFPKGLQLSMPDDNIFQTIISSSINPTPNIITGTVNDNDKEFGYICILKTNTDFTYETKRRIYYTEKNKNHCIAEGQAFTRRGSATDIMLSNNRRELESIITKPELRFQTSLKEMKIGISGLPITLSAAIIGSWDEKQRGDIETIEQLTGEDYATWIQKIQQESASGNENIHHVESVWKIKNREEIILLNQKAIFDQHINTIKTETIKVLSTLDPKYELPVDQRMMAQINGNRDKYSTQIKQGLSELVAIINFNKDAFENCSINIIEHNSAIVVQEILEKRNWKLYQSLGYNLMFLAEAAPKIFMEEITKSLEIIEELFNEDLDDTFKIKCGSGVIHALQVIAWDDRYVGQASLCLAKLCANNKPAMDALVEILLPWHPQTKASKETQIAIVKEVCKALDKRAWVFVNALLPGRRTSTKEIEKPIYLFRNEEEKKVLESDFSYLSNEYLNIYLELKVECEEQIFVLLEMFEEISEAMQKNILAFIFEHTKRLDADEKLTYWNKISDYLDQRDNIYGKMTSLSENELNSLISIKDQIGPLNIVDEATRLFCNDQWRLLKGKNEDYKKAEADLLEKQCEKLEQLWKEEGLRSISKLAERSENPSLVGWCLASSKISISLEQERRIIEKYQDDQSKESLFALGYTNYKVKTQGVNWIEKAEIRKWLPERQAGLFTILPASTDNWNWIENNLGEKSYLYWMKVNIFGLCSGGFNRYALEMLINVERIADALVYINTTIEDTNYDVSTGELLDIFDKFSLEKGYADSFQRIRFDINRLIEWLQAENADSERLALLEWRFFNILDYGTEPKTLFQQIASYPELYVSIIKSLYKRKDGNKETNDVDSKWKNEEQKAAYLSQLWSIMYKWKIMPGMQVDGTFDSQKMNEWIDEVKKLSLECSRFEVAMVKLGHVSYYSPSDVSGFFIDNNVAKMLNETDAENQRDGFLCEVTNARGAHWVDPSGEEEFKLEKLWRERASEANKRGLFILGNLLNEIADDFHREGKKEKREEKKVKANEEN